ncbi:MAG: hypothetical protein ABJE47_14600 [bacterium]
MSACVFASTARADDCAIVESRGSLAPLSGAHITSVDIANEGPDLPSALGMFGAFHVASRQAVIRRQLLFAAGDTVDTLRVGETMRRLRAQRLFSDAVILTRRCDQSGDVALQVRTRDTWTLRPTVRLRAPSQLSFGVEDRNFMGSGRAVTFTREMTLRGNGGALGVTDPYLFGSDVSGNARVSNLAGTHTVRLGLRHRERSLLDNWNAEANFARLSYGDTVVAEKALHTIASMALVSRRIGSSGTSATSVLVGAEFDSAASISTSRSLRMAPPGSLHVRSFVGFDLGFRRRTAQYDSASWIVPGRGFLDIPLGWEGEGVVGSGYERDAQTPALKLDAWMGRVFIPRRGSVLMIDGWYSGYQGRAVDRNEITRASMSWYANAARGMWGARLTGEQLVELDPDRRVFSLMPLADATAPVTRLWTARGGRTLAGSVERDVHLVQVGAASVLNVGGFVGGSYRWQVNDVPNNELKAGVVGARLRLLSANGAVSSIRVDVGYAVIRSEILPPGSFLTVTYGTLFDASRQRDGRRAY